MVPFAQMNLAQSVYMGRFDHHLLHERDDLLQRKSGAVR